MAIYETGAVGGVNLLIDAIRAFALANGWTVNQYTADGNGFRLHLQRGSDVFINLRSVVNEYAQTNQQGGITTGLAVAGSTGHNPSVVWYTQPGAPNSGGGTPTYKMAGMMGIAGAIPAYHLFARGDMIYCVIEYVAGSFLWLGFGRISKYGAWTGGTIFFGSDEGHNNSVTTNIYRNFAGEPPWTTNDLNGNVNAWMHGTVTDYNGANAVTGWLGCVDSPSLSVNMPRFFDSSCLQSLLITNAHNTFNSQPVLLPLTIQVTRDGAMANGGWENYNNFSVEGYLPDAFLCNVRVLLPGQTLTIGSAQYKVFPFRAKNTLGIATGGTSGWQGFAIRMN